MWGFTLTIDKRKRKGKEKKRKRGLSLMFSLDRASSWWHICGSSAWECLRFISI